MIKINKTYMSLGAVVVLRQQLPAALPALALVVAVTAGADRGAVERVGQLAVLWGGFTSIIII